MPAKKNTNIRTLKVTLTMQNEADFEPEVDVFVTINFHSTDRKLVSRLLARYGGQDEFEDAMRRQMIGAMDRIIHQQTLPGFALQ